MSLAFDLFFFWDSTTTSVSADAVGAGGGGGKGKGNKKNRVEAPYDRLDEDFWDVREAYLRAINNETLDTEPVEAEVEAIDEPQPEIARPTIQHRPTPRYVGERATIISALRLTTNTEQLKQTGARLISINRAISAAKKAKWEAERPIREAAFAARKAERKQKLQSLRAEAENLLNSLTRIYKPRF